MIEWLPWLPSKSCYTNLKFFETLKDTPNPSKGFRFVAFLVLEILGGGPFRPPPPLVLGVGTKTLGARRVKKLTKGQLIKLLLKKVSNHEDLLDNDPFKDEVAQEPIKRIKPTPPSRTGKWESVKPKPVPCKSVNEDGYKPIPKPRTDRPLQIPKIKELNRALKGHAKSYEIELLDNLNPLNHSTKTRPLTESHLEDLLKL